MLKYNKIAQDYNNKRKRPWSDFQIYIENLKNSKFAFDGTIMDLGCANGRHLELLKEPNNKLIGIDNSIEFIDIAQERVKKRFSDERDYNKIQLILSDMNFLPFRKKSFDTIFSVAVIHHIHNKNLRKEFFSNIHKLLKNKSWLLFTVWRRWQKKYRNYFFIDWFKRKLIIKYKKEQYDKGLVVFGDAFIPWKLSSKDLIISRYYHFFSANELRKFLKQFIIKNFKKIGGPNKKDNFFILAQKL